MCGEGSVGGRMHGRVEEVVLHLPVSYDTVFNMKTNIYKRQYRNNWERLVKTEKAQTNMETKTNERICQHVN